jgi:alginate O-acetyltransferase complex protein AlgI
MDNLNAALGSNWTIGRVILPIGISFFTFTQIAFLADAWRKGVREYKFVHYGVFVSYFPHLIAGPVLHHAQMMPQFGRDETYRWNSANVVAGLAIFALGLAKKIVLADGVSPYADAVFNAADQGTLPGVQEAWIGALAYTLQLYFDFSGYSDMAIGLSLMFNVRLPFNFDSPYRALNISDFWRRWHISLSTFLRDYLYVPLGGNRHGSARRYLNLALTMLLGGLWHGASWSFVLWGGLHGLYLMLNHGFRAAVPAALLARLDASRLFGLFAWASTLLAVVFAWVFFRAQTLSGAGVLLRAMGGAGTPGDTAVLLWNAGLHPDTGAMWCAALGAIALLPMNSNRLGMLLTQRLGGPAVAAVGGAALAAVLLLVLVNATRDSVSAFIYFNF